MDLKNDVKNMTEKNIKPKISFERCKHPFQALVIPRIMKESKMEARCWGGWLFAGFRLDGPGLSWVTTNKVHIVKAS